MTGVSSQIHFFRNIGAPVHWVNIYNVYPTKVKSYSGCFSIKIPFWGGNKAWTVC